MPHNLEIPMTATTEKPHAKAKKKKVAEDLPHLVDTLGALNAQISAINAEAEAIKATLKDAGKREILGNLFKVVVAEGTRQTLVSDKVRKLPTPEQIETCTKTTHTKSLTVYGL